MLWFTLLRTFPAAAASGPKKSIIFPNKKREQPLLLKQLPLELKWSLLFVLCHDSFHNEFCIHSLILIEIVYNINRWKGHLFLLCSNQQEKFARRTGGCSRETVSSAHITFNNNRWLHLTVRASARSDSLAIPLMYHNLYTLFVYWWHLSIAVSIPSCSGFVIIALMGVSFILAYLNQEEQH